MSIVYLGDELTGAGYRLAGVEVRSPEDGDATRALDDARARGWLVLVAADVAASIDARVLAEAMAAPSPLVLVVPDFSASAPPDIAGPVRTLLGLAEP